MKLLILDTISLLRDNWSDSVKHCSSNSCVFSFQSELTHLTLTFPGLADCAVDILRMI